MSPEKVHVIPLRISNQLNRRIKKVARKSDGLSNAQTMRMAIDKGLPIVEKSLKPSSK